MFCSFRTGFSPSLYRALSPVDFLLSPFCEQGPFFLLILFLDPLWFRYVTLVLKNSMPLRHLKTIFFKTYRESTNNGTLKTYLSYRNFFACFMKYLGCFRPVHAISTKSKCVLHQSFIALWNGVLKCGSSIDPPAHETLFTYIKCLERGTHRSYPTVAAFLWQRITRKTPWHSKSWWEGGISTLTTEEGRFIIPLSTSIY